MAKTKQPKDQQAPVSPGTYRWWAAAAFVSLTLLLALVGWHLFRDNDQPPALGEAVPDFTLTSFSGEMIDSEGLVGKVVLINFWASWCVTCDEEALLLEQAWQRYAGTGQVQFLGVAYMDTEPAALEFLSDYGVTYPNGPDLGGRISNIFQVSAVPETYVLDPEGRLAAVKYGPFTALEEIIVMIEIGLEP
jgi:cytochrome c biogenesis protein CcmG/thiol:disulfide interchange protein DsbE